MALPLRQSKLSFMAKISGDFLKFLTYVDAPKQRDEQFLLRAATAFSKNEACLVLWRAVLVLFLLLCRLRTKQI